MNILYEALKPSNNFYLNFKTIPNNDGMLVIITRVS